MLRISQREILPNEHRKHLLDQTEHFYHTLPRVAISLSCYARNVIRFNTTNKKDRHKDGAPAGILLRLQGLARRDAPQCYESLSCYARNVIRFNTKETNKKDRHKDGAPAGILLRLQGLARRDAPQCFESLSCYARNVIRFNTKDTNKKDRHKDGLFYWCSCGNSNPGHLD